MKGTSDTKNTKKETEEKKDKSKASKFLDKLDFTQISEIENNNVKTSKGSKSEDKHDPHSFPTLGDVIGPERAKEIKSGKSKIILGIGIVIGSLFIIFGAVMMMGSADRVADNVVFGEKQVFAMFLLLIGVLIIACSFAYKYMDKLFLKGIDENIESHDKTSSDSNKNNIKKDNINRNNR